MRPSPLALPLLLAAAGCGAVPGTASYGCGGLPEGVSCVSARDVYRLTDGGKPVVSVAGKETALDAVAAAATESSPARSGAGTSDVMPKGDRAAPGRPDPAMARPGLAEVALLPEEGGAVAVLPLRTPPKVLRVWIAPWEDEQGRLHVPGFTYAEIEPRRWSIGQDDPEQGLRLRPLEPPTPPTPAPTPQMAPELQEVGDQPSPRRRTQPPPAPRRQPPGETEDIRLDRIHAPPTS